MEKYLVVCGKVSTFAAETTSLTIKRYEIMAKYSNEIKERQANVLSIMKDLGIHFIDYSYNEYEYFLKRLTTILVENNIIPKSYHVSTMWFTDGRLCSYDQIDIDKAYIDLSSLNGYYDEINITSLNYDKLPKNTIQVDETILSLIIDNCEELIERINEIREESKKLPNVSELIGTFLTYAKRYIDNDEYVVSVEKGKLNMETTEPYQCIVVRYKDNGEYHSSLVFSKHINGYYQVTQRIPLCGQSTSDFTIDNAEETIRKIINF